MINLVIILKANCRYYRVVVRHGSNNYYNYLVWYAQMYSFLLMLISCVMFTFPIIFARSVIPKKKKEEIILKYY